MFESIFLYPEPEGLRILWDFTSEEIDETPKFFVERRYTNEDSWYRLNSDSPVDNFFYFDSDLDYRKIQESSEYRVIISTSEFGEQISDPVRVYRNWQGRVFKAVYRIIQQEKTRLENPYIGAPGVLKKRRTVGKSCDNCTDYTGKIVQPDCDQCGGTGIEGGFWNSWPLRTEYSRIEDYRQRWRSLSGSFSSDARTVRFYGIGQWVEGDRWEDNSTGQVFALTSEFKVAASIQGVPIIYVGIIDKINDNN